MLISSVGNEPSVSTEEDFSLDDVKLFNQFEFEESLYINPKGFLTLNHQSSACDFDIVIF